jgi:hypothetical protein
MAWYDIKYSCGHQGREQIYGKSSSREWLIDKKSGELCPECYKAELERKHVEESKQAALVNQEEYGLPPLEGTERQVQWAEVVRRKIVDELQKVVSGIGDQNENKPYAVEASQQIMSQSSAHWWIENRDRDIRSLVVEFGEQIKIGQREPDKQSIDIETTVRPETSKTATIAEITVVEKSVHVNFPEKRDDFYNLIKGLGFKWAHVWYKKPLNQIDCAAETGHILLANGFIVRIADKQILDKAISGQFEPERTRLIFKRISGEYNGWFAIQWGRNEDYYAVARKLPRSRYHNRSVVVPPEYFEEIMDFASVYDFKLSPGAEGLVRDECEKKELMLVVRIDREPVTVGRTATVGIPVLSVPENVEINEGLRDDN